MKKVMIAAMLVAAAACAEEAPPADAGAAPVDTMMPAPAATDTMMPDTMMPDTSMARDTAAQM
ncbi:MAG TPA: hypothetical protein VFT04_01780 [Gemmatimonadales bacterium]|nr:hypothetical protein [Gemmatimonadales bacterium]